MLALSFRTGRGEVHVHSLRTASEAAATAVETLDATRIKLKERVVVGTITVVVANGREGGVMVTRMRWRSRRDRSYNKRGEGHHE